MMMIFRRLFLLTLPFHFYLTSHAQVGYSPEVDSLIQEIQFDPLMLLNRQLTGDTAVMVNGTLDTIASRSYNDPGNAVAAQFILESFQSYGLNAEMMDYDDDGQNVIATKTGSLYPDRQVIICAHYDSRPFEAYSPGADDNASGVCGVLEAARLAAGMDFPYTLKFIAFDEEEIGLVGSQAYVDSAYARGDDILAVMNLDMIAWDSDQDDQVSVSSNPGSMHLLRDHMASMRLYRPELSPHYIYVGASDHWRFWSNSYPAVHVIEDRQDFNPYYHTADDNFSNISKDYFHRMTQACLATFFTWALDVKMDIFHNSLATVNHPVPQMAVLQTDPDHEPATGENRPRLYYRVNGGNFDYIHSCDRAGDSLLFSLPSFAYGSEVEYYLAVQDTLGRYIKTLPEGGRGLDPPGTVPPPSLYSYYILRDTSAQFLASGIPLEIPAYDTLTAEVHVPASGRILDINVATTIEHSNTWDLDIYLTGPMGQVAELSTKNGFNGDNYVSTILDDEACSLILENACPFTGSFRPESPLGIFDDGNLQGTWTLQVINKGGVIGSLSAFSLIFSYAHGDIYVDGSVTSSGDGLSWPSALKTISEACQQEPGPGATVFIKPGTYEESVMITSNGEETVPLVTGIQLTDSHRIQFPAGTDLSTIQLDAHPGEYYAYIYRSRFRNTGYYRVLQVDDSQDHILVDDALFLPESGIPGDSNQVSCAVGRPVIYKNHTGDPENEAVIVSPDSGTGMMAVLYVGDSVGGGSATAFPSDFNIIDGLHLTGGALANGLQIQNSSFNIVRNCKIYENGRIGIQISGSEDYHAQHNMLVDNVIYNTPGGGIAIGIPEQSSLFNRACYNQLMSNEISVMGSGPNASMRSAITVGDHNKGSVIKDNYLHGFTLEVEDVSALDIYPGAHHTFVYGNIFRNIGSSGIGPHSLIRLYDGNENTELYNNTLSDSIPGTDDMYAFRLDGGASDSCRVVHNTIYQIRHGFFLEDYTTINDFQIKNNIIHVTGNYFTHSGYEGRFLVTHNLYPANPTPDTGMAYFHEEGRQIGIVEFVDPDVGDFHLKISSGPALSSGDRLNPVVYIDPDREIRYSDAPDIGAYELEDKVVWEGTVNQEWNEPANWDPATVPGHGHNVIIEDTDNFPRITSGSNQVKGIYLMEGADLHVKAPATLILSSP